MRQTARLKSLAPLCVLWLCAWPIAARAQQQGSGQQPEADPVAEAARKAREQRKTEPKPKKVYTDDDVKPATPASQGASAEAKPAAETGETGAQAAAKPVPGEAAAGGGESDEQKWRKKFKDMHAKIAQAEQELSILQRELEKGQVQYYTDPTKAMKEQNSRQEINDKTDKIDAKKKEIEQLKQQLSDMEDELRKSGGDIGWSRE